MKACSVYLPVTLAALLCTGTAEAGCHRRPITDAALETVLRRGHVVAFGRRPSQARLDVAVAQTSLETGMRPVGHNVGGIGAPRGQPRCGRLRRYRSAVDGARAYWAAVKPVLAWFDAGDPDGAARALGQRGYFTAPVESYAAAMVDLYRERTERRR